MSQRALLYLRQSDSDGAGERSLSLDSQSTILRADAERLHWVIVGEIRDADLRGHDETRPGLLALYERCRAGDVDVVAFWRLDRLARKLRLQENILHELETLGITVWSNQDPHSDNPLFRQMLGAFNEELTRMISANVRLALRERTRRKLPHGPAPFGYKRTSAGILTPSPDASTVREIFAWRAEGHTLRDIMDLLDRRGQPSPTGREWSRHSLATILANPVYRGEVRLSEVTVTGAHRPLIAEDAWQRVQERRDDARHRAPRRKATVSWLEGLIVHACGEPMYLGVGTPSRPRHTIRCRSGAGWARSGRSCGISPQQIGADRAETLTWAALTDLLTRLPASPRRIIAAARARHRMQAPATIAAQREAQERRRRAVVDRQRAADMYVSGRMDLAWFDAQDARLAAVEREADVLLARLPEPPDESAIEAAWQHLRGIAEILVSIEGLDRGPVLREIGVAVIGPVGYRSGRGDAGQVAIRVSAEWRDVLDRERG